MKKLTLAAVIIFAMSCRSFASEAIASYQFDTNSSFSPISGDLQFGAGFIFSPTLDLNVTSLGYMGSLSAQTYQISIWDLSGNKLASTTITMSSATNNQSQYEPISLLTLSAGQTYYIDAEGTVNGHWTGLALLRSPNTNENGSFTTGPDLGYLAAAWASNSIVEGSPLQLTLADNTALLIAANFEYTVAPEPSAVCLATGAGVVMIFGRRVRNRRNPRRTASRIRNRVINR